LGVPVKSEPLVGVLRSPPLFRGGMRPQGGLNLGQSRPVAGDSEIAEGGSVSHRVEGEVIDVALELEFDHPVDELGGRHLRGGGSLGM